MRRFSARLRHSAPLIFALALMTACTSAAPPAATPAPAVPTPPPTQAPVRPLESQTSPAASPVAAASPAASPAAGVASPAAQPAGKPGGNFTVAQTSDAVSFHPFTTTDASSHGYQGLIYAGDFWEYDPDTLQPKPAMARSWTVSSDKL
ncbi:MAG: hypothetical protein IT307_02735, partial [Chloroflexi bacterium]|nr:hypothetical protein [Chloroflexota bacterium]